VDRISELNAVVAEFDLNLHPFYQDWRAGTLPTEKLTDYSGEYGRFVATVAMAWETLGRSDYAQEERDHEVLWSHFQAALGQTALANHSATETLVAQANRLFNGTTAEAAGSLYAFEKQQPSTSESKLAGLKEHYSIDAPGMEYFRVHAGDVQEAEDLANMIERFSPEDFEVAKASCRSLASNLWLTLEAIYSAPLIEA
jgi:pyrroloquinoline-quinone synthase